MEAGRAVITGENFLEALQQRIEAALGAAQRPARISAGSRPTGRQPTEREYQAMMRGYEPEAEADKLAMVNKMLELAPGGKKELLQRMLGAAGKDWPQVPTFHTEISKTGSCPAHCDMESSFKKARDSFIQSSCFLVRSHAACDVFLIFISLRTSFSSFILLSGMERL